MDIRKKLQNGQLVTGLWMQGASPVTAEIFAETEMDFVALDMEHGDAGEVDFAAMARAFGGKSAPFARVRENNPMAIRRVLDMGARGVIVPLVNDAQQAQQAAAATRFPPDGVRGYSFCRANQWGQNFDGYRTGEGADIILIVMIESVEAVEAIEEIVQVPGVDGVLIGPYDLSGSYGVPGELEHPAMKTGMAKVVAACQKHQKAAGLHVVTPTPQALQEALQAGYTFLPVGMDTIFVRQGAWGAAEMLRKAAGQAEKAKG